jgi:hypothetical protein
VQEFLQRKSIFMKNLRFILDHNSRNANQQVSRAPS